MKDIKKFLQKNIKDIELGNKGVEDLLKAKSMRCVEVSWIISHFLRMPDRETKKILDLGTSFFDRAYFKIFFEMVIASAGEFNAIDIIPFRPERFADYMDISLLEGKINFKKGDMRQAPFPDNSFDSVLCISVIEHIGFDEEKADKSFSSFNRPEEPPAAPALDSWDEDFKAIKEVGRVLRAGGKILLTVPFGAAEIFFEKDSLGLYASSVQYDEKRLGELINASGAEITEKRIFVYDDNVGWTDKLPSVIPSPQKALACVVITK